MIHFVVHDEGDSVGVVVVEGVKASQELTGWIMDQDREIKVRAQSDIPIGHKLAVRALAKDDTVIKYGTDIGRAVAPIRVGEHAHVHNIKTKRWQHVNVQTRRIWVPELKRFVSLDLTTRDIRTIDKVGITAYARRHGINLARV